MIRPDCDNITNTALSISADPPTQPNDPNHLVVKRGDQVRWQAAAGIDITHIVIGKRRDNVSDKGTDDVFNNANPLPPEPNSPRTYLPLRTYDERLLDVNQYTTINIDPSDHAIGFSYRIYLQNRSDGKTWWIDPEFDVCP